MDMGVLLLCSHNLWFLGYPWWGAGLVVCVGCVLWGVGVLLGALGNFWVGGGAPGPGSLFWCGCGPRAAVLLGAGSGAGGFCGFGEVSKNTC